MDNNLGNIMILGACGQIGSELTASLRSKYGDKKVLAVDKKEKKNQNSFANNFYEKVNVLDKAAIKKTIKKHNIDTVFNLAAILSAKGEKNPQQAFRVNVIGSYNTLEISRELKLKKLIIPSSIAVFGPEVQKNDTPNEVY